MSIVVPKNDLIDDLYLHKHIASNKMCQVLSMVENYGTGNSKKMIKTASKNNELITLFSNMLAALNMNANENNIKEIVNKIADSSNLSDDLEKHASINKDSQERKDSIKIVSKSVKDSHYQVDVSKDIIKSNNKKMFMISCYARDAYLGRYLIKRNYFFTMDRGKFANNAYDEILTKVGDIKDRYYNEVIDVSAIFTQIKQALDGVISEIEIKEDSLGTNVSR